jgi:hypothetical protein
MIKDGNVKWTANLHSHECPLHDKGPSAERLLEATLVLFDECEAQLTEITASITMLVSSKNPDVDEPASSGVPLTPEPAVKKEPADAASMADLASKRTERLIELRDQEGIFQDKWKELRSTSRRQREFVDRYKRHLKQYEICRPLMKQLEGMLKPGECVMYRDFVNQYMCGGSKLSNLVLVVIWRCKDGAPTMVVKFNNFCDDPASRGCDAFYVADVFHLYVGSQDNACQFFKREGITNVFLSGDHGPHFTSIKTIYNESLFFERYGIVLVCFFLCSYHAFNRCDAAGVESVRIVLTHMRGRGAIAAAIGYASAMNQSNYHNSFGVELPSICRNVTENPVFPELVENDKLDLRSKCEIRYSWLDEDKNVV